ncbi:hypothetical protein ACIPL1_27800 [Pseudomonas sp. NPDC090202]|uniref:hypothetical protein n=1 Tax=Pseudomonas sp. NPDC090202 TaxID=3364476 RepID=UPI0037FB1205
MRYRDLMLYNLPPFKPVTQGELRQLWAQYPDPEIRRLILEAERCHRVLARVDDLYKGIHQSWRESVGGGLAGLQMLLDLTTHERMRLGYTVTPEPQS